MWNMMKGIYGIEFFLLAPLQGLHEHRSLSL